MFDWVEKITNRLHGERWQRRQVQLVDVSNLAEAATASIAPILHLSTLEQRALHKYILARLVASTPYQNDAKDYLTAARDISLFREAYRHDELFQLATAVGEELVAAQMADEIERLPSALDALAEKLIRKR